MVVAFRGGLGNQFFQYSFGKFLEDRLESTVSFNLSLLGSTSSVKRSFELDYLLNSELFDETNLSDLMNLMERWSHSNKNTRRYNRVIYNLVYRCRVFLFCLRRGFLLHTSFNSLLYLIPRFVPCKHIFLGDWQQKRFAIFAADEIRTLTMRKFSLSSYLDKVDGIESQNSICLHVRRGDYVSNSQSSSFHGFLGLEYFEDAVKVSSIFRKIEKIFVFSDDIDWCRRNLKFKPEVSFIDFSQMHRGNIIEFSLMMNGKNFIISNSTYSWWAAFLSLNDDSIVVAPKKWFAGLPMPAKDLDLYVSNWIYI